MKVIKTIGVIGAGTMGSAIAQKFAQEGYVVYLNDREKQFVDKGISGIKQILEQGVERKLFTADQVLQILNNLIPTINQDDLKKCDLIVEAIFEDFNVKSQLFKVLDKIVPSDTIIATNTSSFSVSELAENISNPERFVGLHYFYHAAKNRLVEIIPGKKTSKETLQSVFEFSVLAGKDPIFTADTYGFAVNRFFVPWLNEACKILQEGIATTSEIDALCMHTFNIGMGPFALMNATGVPIALHAQKTLEHFGPSYKVASVLEQQVDLKQNWSVENEELNKIQPEKLNAIKDRILGCTFFVCSQILNEKVCSAAELNRGAKIGLRWKSGPVDLMIKNGTDEVARLVKQYAGKYGEKYPDNISADNWRMDFVTSSIDKSVAIITMTRPEDLNALNEIVVKQLDEHFTRVNNNPAVKTIVLTGTGKAFVAGADIKFFVSNIKSNTLNNIVSFTKYGQEVLNKIDKSDKKVVCILNGMALGGGMELALCCDVILAVPKVKIAFPETGIGIYPGLGGTQRTRERLGKGLAKYLVLTGQMLDANTAFEIGLVDEIINPEDIFKYTSGEKQFPDRRKVVLSNKWSALENLYSNNSYKSILEGNIKETEIEKEAVERLVKTMKFKAPIAMALAEELIDNAKGPSSELEKLIEIFSTKDALLGLSSIGQKVEYKGE